MKHRNHRFGPARTFERCARCGVERRPLLSPRGGTPFVLQALTLYRPKNERFWTTEVPPCRR